jgi:hypothetical protein
VSSSPANGNGFSQRYSTIIQTVTVVALFIAGFWGAVIQPLTTKINESISRQEHEEFKLRVDRDLIRLEAERLRDKDGFRARFTRDVVPRSEHETERAAMMHDISVVSDRLNELRTATTSTYTMRDEIQRLQTELTELRTAISRQGLTASPK